MNPRPKGIVGVFKETFKSFGEDKASRLAAALSYYTIFSIAPLLVLVIAITGFIIGSNTQIRNQVLGQIQGLVGAQGAQMVDTLITNTSRPRDGIIASVIGVLTLIFGATGVFIQLKEALNTIWEVTRKKGLGVGGAVKERLSGLVMILGLGFLLLVTLVISAALSVLNAYFTNLLGNSGLISMVINYAIQILVITIIFGAIYRGVPDVELHWRDVWVGALFTTILFLVGQYVISLYLTRASPTSAYGAAGSLVVLLLWIYYSAQILFLGAEFTKAYSLARGMEIVPNENARLLTPTDRIQQGIPHRLDEAAPVGPAAAVEQAAAGTPAANRPARERPAPPSTAPIPATGDSQPKDEGDQGKVQE